MRQYRFITLRKYEALWIFNLLERFGIDEYRYYSVYFFSQAASWRKRLGARLPPLGSRVRVSVPLCGFRGGRNGVWVGFSRGFSRCPLPQISFSLFSTLISSNSFHFIRPCDGATGVVGRHPCYSRTYNMGASSHLIPRPDLVLRIFIYLFLFPPIYFTLCSKETEEFKDLGSKAVAL